ncbi:MAG: SGNH/GDSL hydrolase family protein [Myxococcota bacterium]
MSRLLAVSAVTAVTIGGASDVRAAESIVLPEKGTVIFLGDSITWQNLYVAYVESVLSRAFPERRLRYVNLGVRGDTAIDARRRLDRDVVPRDPALVFVMLGLNDGGLEGVSGRLLDAYARNMARLVSDLRSKTRARVVLLTSTCIDPLDDGKRQYNEMLARMAERLRALARKERLPMIDIYTPFRRALERARSATPPVAMMADPLHPGPVGHLVVAHTILQRILPDGREGASIEASLPQSACSDDGAKLLVSHDHRNAWVPPDARPGLAFAPLHSRFNRQLLVVGNAACTVRLTVGALLLGTFSAKDLAAGVDLNAVDSAPWARDAERHYRMTQARWRWFYTTWDPHDVGEARALRDVGGPAGLDDATARKLATRELAKVERVLARRKGAQVYELRAARAAKKPASGATRFRIDVR